MSLKPQNKWMIVDPDGNPVNCAIMADTADDAIREFVSLGEYAAEGEVAEEWNERYYSKGYRACLVQLSQVMVCNWELKVF